MDLSSGKKSVRFSSPFERTCEPEVTVIRQPPKRKIPEAVAPNMESKGIIGNSSDSSFSGDSWDAFDAKMMKSKVTPATTQVKNQFLELSITQNKSLNVEEEDDFAAMSFQDAKELIEKDENERLQFMNSNVTFDGIDQVEAPSLLSLTSYFQQGSSFPVPYTGNDSTMMFGGGLPPGVSSFLDPKLASETLRRFSSSSSQQYSLRNSSITRRASTSKISAAPNNSTLGSASVASEKSDIARNDSLAKFFLGPGAQGLDKNGIMEHVLDYCKRRASFIEESNTFTLNSPDRDASGTDGADNDPAATLYYRGELGDEKTVIDMRSKMDTKTLGRHSVTTAGDVKTKDNYNDSPTVTNDHGVDHEDHQDSIVISSDRAATMKPRKGPLLNVSDMGTGSSEGFENFKRNLTTGRDRYRDKVNHRVEFEKKRLQIDERYSHPQLSPKALSGPGATASLGRPSKRMFCNSPPEKLVTHRNEPAPVVTRDENAVMNRQELHTPRMAEGQYHSTPLAVDSFIRRISNVNVQKSSRVERVPSSRRAVEPERLEGKKEDHNKKHGVYSREAHSSESTSPELSSKRQSSGTQVRRRKSPLTLPCKNNEIHSQATQIIEPSVPDSSSNDASNSNVLKTSNAQPLPPPPQNFSVVPVIHSTGQHQHQHFGGGQQCSCPHQCGQQSMPHGMAGMMQGLPIVIHIHLPGQTTTTTGSMVHPVPTPTTEAPPK